MLTLMIVFFVLVCAAIVATIVVEWEHAMREIAQWNRYEDAMRDEHENWYAEFVMDEAHRNDDE